VVDVNGVDARLIVGAGAGVGDGGSGNGRGSPGLEGA
jgi:hypothetical protein